MEVEITSAVGTEAAPGTPTESGSLSLHRPAWPRARPPTAPPTRPRATGPPPYSSSPWRRVPCPSGLTLNTSTGVISGTPSGTAGSYTFTVSATNPFGTGSATLTQTLALAAGSASQLVFTTSPGNSTNGVAFSTQPVVKVEDSGGNVVTGSSASILLSPSSGSLGCTTRPARQPCRLDYCTFCRPVPLHRHRRLGLQPDRHLDRV